MKNTPIQTLTGIPGAMLAPNEQAFMDLLFTGPKTADGYVVRIRKTGCVDFRFRNHDLTLTRKGIIAQRSRLNGRTWFSYTGKEQWPFDWRETDTFIEALRNLVVANPAH